MSPSANLNKSCTTDQVGHIYEKGTQSLKSKSTKNMHDDFLINDNNKLFKQSENPSDLLNDAQFTQIITVTTDSSKNRKSTIKTKLIRRFRQIKSKSH
jgi:hypothetical protein